MRFKLVPVDEMDCSLNDSKLPSEMIFKGGETLDKLYEMNSAEYDFDSCAIAVGVYNAMATAYITTYDFKNMEFKQLDNTEIAKMFFEKVSTVFGNNHGNWDELSEDTKEAYVYLVTLFMARLVEMLNSAKVKE